jgi:hypothetical protein
MRRIEPSFKNARESAECTMARSKSPISAFGHDRHSTFSNRSGVVDLAHSD